jgi:Domain of unknown function (DUF5655)
MPRAPDDMLSAVSQSLAARTGRSLEEWLTLVQASGLAEAIGALGDDVTVEGRGSYIPFVRGRQFAAIAAAARDRVDLGLRFTDPPGAARLQPASGPGQATHKLSLRNVSDVDDEVRSLLRTAYEQNT